MKMKTVSPIIQRTILMVIALAGATTCSAQGTLAVTFNQWPRYSFAQFYSESGVELRVLSTNGNAPQSYMVQMPGGPLSGFPTPFMDFAEDHGANSGFVSVNLQTGQSFGLVSVDIGNIGPAPTVQFVGYLLNGGTVSATYYFPNYYTMENFTFGSAFAEGLTRVDIFSQGYALDNIFVTVPEPGTYALLGLGLLAFTARRFHQRRKF